MYYKLSILANIAFLFYFIYSIKTETQTEFKILFLKTQILAQKRRKKKFHTKPFQRLTLLLLSYVLPDWKANLAIVSPDTLLKWRKEKFKIFWAMISGRKKPGRPNTPWTLIKLIRKVAKENGIWGATKLHGLLRKLGYDISERTVSKYIPKRPPDPKKRLLWKQFYSLHADAMLASDTFTVYSANFSKIFRVVFFLHVGSRQILHFDIHTNPTTRWMRRVLKCAIRKQEKRISYFLSDNDPLFGKRFTRYLERIGIKHKKTARKSPWQNCYAERWIKTCRNEFLDFFIPINEYHLRKNLDEFIHFYNHHRTHLALHKDTPIPSCILERPPDAKLVSTPILGGLYHTYSYKKTA
ncbi:integrase core domain protein [Leptospira fainei serovar Hurstbridge str. BUT 6]|uniref:Integrase core domain protein n=1 Tax=Leptospira fainei serovar Hurstbridge str. BUT 6 TaxID=1193011 RepID=S3V3E3_9LEPT|nr:integrase core domain-containing protein [Leptospira fainei]EPG75933.1 integrase core domain protein [Leptospira fainei serovar Hurstbridge str. BUT 6]